MAQTPLTKKYNTFVKGLITEASAINFPENASVDEDNFVLSRDGSRERRLGMDYETGYVKTSADLDTYPTGAVASYSWNNAGKIQNKNFLVVHTGKQISIFEYTSAGYGAAHTQYDVGVDTPSISYAQSPSNIASHPFSFTAVNGVLFCAQKTSKPFYITYDGVADTFTIVEYSIKVRDIWGVPLGAATSVTDRPKAASLTGVNGWLHKYNLHNQGWPYEEILMASTTGTPPVSGAGVVAAYPVDQTIADMGYAPALSDSFYLAHGLLDSGVAPVNVDVYRPDMLTTNPLMGLQLPKGRMIIDAFLRNRQEASGLYFSGQEDLDQGTPTLLESFAGRVWYAGVESKTAGDPDFDDKMVFNSTVFFSQIIESLPQAGKCYQENDPTSEFFSDILDTDGGTIEIAGAGRIHSIKAMHNFLVVFADNGVWSIIGGQNGFTAAAYAVRQVSNVGCISTGSVVRVENSILYWSDAGIYAVSVDPQARDLRAENITETSIQTFYDAIPNKAKRFCQGVYDDLNRSIRWLYSDDSTFDSLTNTWIKTRELVYDVVLQAWSPNTISPLAADTPYIMDVVSVPKLSLNTVQDDVQVDGVDVEANNIQVEIDILEYNDNETVPLYVVGDGTFFTFGRFTNTSFLDWVTEDATGIDYESYLVTGYESLEEFARQKQASYITTLFNRTEQNFIDDGSGNAVLDFQSACTLQARWDWADHDNSGKWGNTQEAYRLKRVFTPSGTLPESFDNGQPITVTKSKLRGKGRSNHLKFTSQTGKYMHLLGWQIEYMGKDKV